MKGIAGTGQLDWEMPRGPAEDPGKKPSSAGVWREPPERNEGLSRSTEPLAPSPSVKGFLAPQWGRSWAALLPFPSCCLPLSSGRGGPPALRVESPGW